MIDRAHTTLQAAIDAALAAGADDVEAGASAIDTEFTRFASSRFTQVGTAAEESLRVRVLVGGRLGSAISASIDPAAAAATAAAAIAAARRSPPLDTAFSFATPSPSPPTPHPSPPPGPLPEAVTAAGAPALLAAAFAPHRAAGVDFAGSLKATRKRLWVRTAAGAAGDHDGAAADVRMIGRAAGSSGHACAASSTDRPLDLPAVAAAAADRALRGRDPIDVDPGRWDVLLAPAAVAELIEWMAEASFRGTALIDGTSLLAGRTGAPVCDPRITITDRPGPGDPSFDAEGTPRRAVACIRDGVGGHALTDRLTALRLGDAGGSTGHAAPLGDVDFGTPGPQHLWLAPGDATEEQLCAGIERGIYVTRFFYVNGLLDTRRATMTGMTRDGTFLIEHGRLGRGVRNLRFTDSILEALGSERLGGIGRDAVDIPTWWSEGGVISVPALLLRAFHFTGTSR